MFLSSRMFDTYILMFCYRVVESTSETAYTIKPWPGYCSDTDAFSLCKTSI